MEDVVAIVTPPALKYFSVGEIQCSVSVASSDPAASKLSSPEFQLTSNPANYYPLQHGGGPQTGTYLQLTFQLHLPSLTKLEALYIAQNPMDQADNHWPSHFIHLSTATGSTYSGSPLPSLISFSVVSSFNTFFDNQIVDFNNILTLKNVTMIAIPSDTAGIMHDSANSKLNAFLCNQLPHSISSISIYPFKNFYLGDSDSTTGQFPESCISNFGSLSSLDITFAAYSNLTEILLNLPSALSSLRLSGAFYDEGLKALNKISSQNSRSLSIAVSFSQLDTTELGMDVTSIFKWSQSLETLSLDHVGINGTLPGDFIAQMPKLRSLTIINNLHLEGAVPWYGIDQPDHLDLTGNKFQKFSEYHPNNASK